MQKLSNHWFVEGHIDFEYKKYLLLAYLQQVDHAFEQTQLYPHLGELVKHYRILQDYLDKSRKIQDQFPRRISQVNLDQFRLSFEQVVQDDALMEEIKTIVEFSSQEIHRWLQEGQKIYDWLEDHFDLREIGLTGLYSYEGLLMLQNGDAPETKAYRYTLSRLEGDQSFLRLKTEYLTSFYVSHLMRNYQQLKLRALRQFRQLADCAAFVIESEWRLPERETFIPIARRLLIRRLGAA